MFFYSVPYKATEGNSFEDKCKTRPRSPRGGQKISEITNYFDLHYFDGEYYFQGKQQF